MSVDTRVVCWPCARGAASAAAAAAAFGAMNGNARAAALVRARARVCFFRRVQRFTHINSKRTTYFRIRLGVEWGEGWGKTKTTKKLSNNNR